MDEKEVFNVRNLRVIPHIYYDFIVLFNLSNIQNNFQSTVTITFQALVTNTANRPSRGRRGVHDSPYLNIDIDARSLHIIESVAVDADTGRKIPGLGYEVELLFREYLDTKSRNYQYSINETLNSKLTIYIGYVPLQSLSGLKFMLNGEIVAIIPSLATSDSLELIEQATPSLPPEIIDQIQGYMFNIPISNENEDQFLQRRGREDY